MRHRRLPHLALLILLGCGFAIGRPSVSARAAEPVAGDNERSRKLLDTYRKMLREDPNQAYAFRRLLEVSHTVGGVGGLIDVYKGELDAKPRDYSGWVVLGHLYRTSDKVDEALAAYAKATEIKPKKAGPHLAAAELHRRGEAWDKALVSFDAALELVRDRDLKQDTLKLAAETALQSKDIERAQAYFDKLVSSDPRNAFLRMEIASSLARLGFEEQSLEAWQEVRKRTRGELKHQVIVLKEIAELQERLDKLDEAEATWREGLERTPAKHWARSTFLEGLIGIHRQRDTLRQLIAEFEPQARRSYEMLVTVARLHEELAEDDKALALYRDAVAKRGSDTSVRLRLIALLERIGKPEEVIAAYRALIKVTPGEVRHELRLAELYFHRGRSKQGFELLGALGRRYRDDPGVHQAIIDLTMRYGDDKARRRIEGSFKTLMRLEPEEEAHVISLGEYYWTEGKRPKALTTWKRLLSMGRSKAEGWFMLAQTLSDHGLRADAAQAFEKAIELEPDNERYAKAYALMLEKQEQFTLALEQWRRVLEGKSDKPRRGLMREARRHVINLWQRDGSLDAQVARLAKRFAADPPDLTAGQLLSEAYLRLPGGIAKAEQVLERLRSFDPDNVEALLGLETVYTRQNKLREAIGVLEALAAGSTRSAPDYLHRAADLALSVGDEKLALKYMRKVVEISPADPLAHTRVGDLYRRMGNTAQAAEAWRQALVLDPRNTRVQFSLASLYRDLGNLIREEQALAAVVREARDPSDVLRAGRRLLQVAVTTGRLESVEEVLRPLARSRQNRAAYQRLLVDLYLLICQHHLYEEPERSKLADKLSAVGTRALKPLLDALLDSDVAVRARALDVLRLSRPPGAAPALARLTQQTEGLVQFQSAIALGHVGTSSAVGALSNLLSSPTRENRQVAVWALGLVDSEEATRALIALLGRRGDSRTRALAALALGRHPRPEARETLERVATESGDVGVAALWALGRLRDPASKAVLQRRVKTNASATSAMAAWGLSRMGDAPSRQMLADQLWKPGAQSSDALLALLGRVTDASAAAYDAMVDYSKGALDVGLGPIKAASRPAPPEADEAALAAIEPLVKARVDAIFSRGDRTEVLHFLSGISQRKARLELGPHASGPAGHALLTRLTAPHKPALLRFAAGELGGEVQIHALAVLARIPLDEAQGRRAKELSVGLLDASSARLRRAAAELLSVAVGPEDQTALEALRAAVADPRFAEEILFRVELARLAGRLRGPGVTEVLEVLMRDRHATVRREAALAASGRLEGALVPLVIDLAEDSVADVALAAVEALMRSPDPRAKAALERLSKSAGPQIRRAIRRGGSS